MNALTTDVLRVPGATLHHEVRGHGPVLLLIPGGNGDAGTFDQIADPLADRFTVIAYDRRGYSRSTLEGPVPTDRLRHGSDDAAALLRLFGNGPVTVLGSSSGAVVGLDLVVRHPGLVDTLVAHEPPALLLLPDAEEQLAFIDSIHDLYLREGAIEAMRVFSAAVGLDPPLEPHVGAQLPPRIGDLLARMRSNLGLFLDHELRQYVRVRPDVDALRATSTRLVLAVGHDSGDALPARPNGVLGARLGLPPAHFPGGHVGYLTHSPPFAARLAEVLG